MGRHVRGVELALVGKPLPRLLERIDRAGSCLRVGVVQKNLRAALRQSLEEGRTVFWSRSRQEVWRKGDTSGDRQFVRQAFYDCDGDTLRFVVEQEGKGACHTGERSCFYRAFG